MLSRLGIKATFFIITHLKKFEGKTLLTSKPELIKEISKSGHEIGSHSKTHANLVMMPLHKVEEEARESKQLLENLVGDEIRGFAYPYGAYNTHVIKIISKHYKYARGAGINPLEDPFNVNVKNKYTLGAFTKRRKHIRKILRLPIKLVGRHYDEYLGIVIVMHRESLLEILTLVKYLRFLSSNVYFVTMSELIELLVRNCSI